MSPNYFGAFHSHIRTLYNGCGHEHINLAAGPSKTNLNAISKAIESALKRIHKNEGFSSSDLFEIDEYKTLVNETSNTFQKAIETGLKKLEVIEEDFILSLNRDAYKFSAIKTNAQLLEVAGLIKKENGKLKSFNEFRKDVSSIVKNYNSVYLEAEYEFAVASSQMASKWKDIDKEKSNLQYRTAQDDKVGEDHQPLHGITLPVEDTFWNSYYPPNRWRCRCDAPEVLKDKYPESDSKKARKLADKTTKSIGKSGKDKNDIFRFNPGKQEVIFPPKHPYNKVKGAQTVKRNLQ